MPHTRVRPPPSEPIVAKQAPMSRVLWVWGAIAGLVVLVVRAVTPPSALLPRVKPLTAAKRKRRKSS
jgi:hypothetical protein